MCVISLFFTRPKIRSQIPKANRNQENHKPQKEKKNWQRRNRKKTPEEKAQKSQNHSLIAKKTKSINRSPPPPMQQMLNRPENQSEKNGTIFGPRKSRTPKRRNRNPLKTRKIRFEADRESRQTERQWEHRR